jgi:N-acetylglucosaminyldiphosphoundecaprenol N-acetyl-beta-D-mannosaminyltransferase
MESPAASTATIELFGVPIHALTMAQVLDRIDHAIAARQRLHIGVVNTAKVVNMDRDELLRRDVLSSDLIVADGMGIVWASRLLGRPLPERVTGIDLMIGMLQRGHERGSRVYCLGATEEISQRVASEIGARFPGVRLVGRRNGYFRDHEEQAIAEAIAEARPDILFVAITSPKKEQFLARWGERIGVPVLHGVGGSFDVLAGKVQRAPETWQRLGLEWLYRVKQEPRRLWRRYLVTNTIFVGMVFKAFAGRLWNGSRP